MPLVKFTLLPLRVAAFGLFSGVTLIALAMFYLIAYIPWDER